MTIKSILVPLPGPQAAAVSLKAAFSIAASFDAHVEALHARPDARMIAAAYMSDTMSGPMIEQVMKDTESQSLQNARKTREAFDKACAAAKVRYAEKPGRTAGVTAAWREDTGEEDQLLRRYGRIADLIVLPRPTADLDVGIRLSLEAALMETGRPLLLVPPKAPAKIGGNIAIAWNGSTEAARAVDEAKPFLANARKVTILTAAEKNLNIDPEGLQSFLAWHGVKAAIEKVRVRGDVGKALVSTAVRVGADMLVMGAYSHSRVREMILGGVTRHVISEVPMTALMAH
jgi:nucleotide-binding universal stress UspA family protein